MISNWTELSIPCGVISSTDVTIVTSSLQNYQKMLEIEFPTKRISWIYNVSKIEKTAATGYLYMIRPSYNLVCGRDWTMVIGHQKIKNWIFKTKNVSLKGEIYQFFVKNCT